jgi:hypothetical protein
MKIRFRASFERDLNMAAWSVRHERGAAGTEERAERIT